MNLLQFQFEKLTEEEYEIIPEFCEMLKDFIYGDINTKLNRTKVKLRIPYLYKVSWINWKKPVITTGEIMETIYEAIKYVEYKDNVFRLQINPDIMIPNTTTSIDRLVRFLDYGDYYQHGIGILNTLEHKYNYKKLNELWTICVVKYIGYRPNSKIIGGK